MRLKGYSLVLTIAESLVVILAVIILLNTFTSLKANRLHEQREFRCVVYNISLAETIKSLISSGVEVEDVFELTLDNEEYNTKVVYVDSFEIGQELIYKVIIDTSYRGDYYEDAEITFYANTV